MARSSASATARCAALTLPAATATVMPRPIAAGVFGIARTTWPPQTSPIAAMVMPAMIETTSVDDAANGRNCGPASRNICGFSATTSAATLPKSFGAGLSRTPFAASALISSEGYGSITATRFASSPCASQPDSIAPPILPAPASTMVPCRSGSALAGEVITTTFHVVPAKAGTHNHRCL